MRRRAPARQGRNVEAKHFADAERLARPREAGRRSRDRARSARLRRASPADLPEGDHRFEGRDAAPGDQHELPSAAGHAIKDRRSPCAAASVRPLRPLRKSRRLNRTAHRCPQRQNLPTLRARCSEKSYAVLWRDGDGPISAGKLVLGPTSLRLEAGSGAGRVSSKVVLYRSSRALRTPRRSTASAHNRRPCSLGAEGSGLP